MGDGQLAGSACEGCVAAAHRQSAVAPSIEALENMDVMTFPAGLVMRSRCWHHLPVRMALPHYEPKIPPSHGLLAILRPIREVKQTRHSLQDCDDAAPATTDTKQASLFGAATFVPVAASIRRQSGAAGRPTANGTVEVFMVVAYRLLQQAGTPPWTPATLRVPQDGHRKNNRECSNANEIHAPPSPHPSCGHCS